MTNFVKEPILGQDYPDPDVIRVDDTFYMISTTMHFMPGAAILRSYNLVDWEIASYVYDKLDSTEGQKLDDSIGVYGKGMWAASIRYNKGFFYVVFVCNDTNTTYLYKSASIYGPWKKSTIEGFYHDCSLYFEDDRVYIIYGNTDIYITELNENLTGPKVNGLHKLIISDEGNTNLGYEGSHFYKIDGRYYLFLIHCKRDKWLRTEACFSSESLTGDFTGEDVIVHENGYRNSGIAQGGIVDDIDGNYYGIIFQDRGASGRIPYLLPLTIKGEKITFYEEGQLPADSKPGYLYESLYTSEFLNKYKELNLQWQWNHEPDLSLIEFDSVKNSMLVTTDRVCNDLVQAKNTLTQRVTEYLSEMSVTVDASLMNNGDVAGLSAFMGVYGYIGLEKKNNKYYLLLRGKDVKKCGNDIWKSEAPLEEYQRIEIEDSSVKMKVVFDCREKDTARFYYETEGEYIQFGKAHDLAFRLDHFCGCRFALFYYSTITPGGKALFTNPQYALTEDS